jgi:hypothetical protein
VRGGRQDNNDEMMRQLWQGNDDETDNEMDDEMDDAKR